MPTTVVKTIGASGADYTTPALWEAAAPADLVAADQVWEGQILSGNNFSNSNIVVEMAGSTSDATRYKHLTTASGASFQDHASASTNALFVDSTKGATLTSTGNYGDAAVVLTESYSRVSKLQIAATSGSGSRNRAIHIGSTNYITSCLIEGYGNSTSNGVIRTAGGNIINCLVVQAASSANNIIFAGGSGTVNIDNCTLVAPNGASMALRRSYNTYTVRNTAMFGVSSGTVHGGSGGTTGFTTCYSDAAAITGVTNIAFASAGFASTTNNFRITSGSALKDAGTTIGDITQDVMGTARPQGSSYDVGAHEYESGGGGGGSELLPKLMQLLH